MTTAIRPLGQRDGRIDFFRGLALLSIFINHVPGNILEPFTHKNFGLSDSAELFVLLAGIAAAFAYFPRFADGDRLLASAKAVKRAGTLFVAHQASTMVGLGIFAAGALWFSKPALLAEINIGPFLEDPVRGVLGFAAMTHQLGYHNILPMYVLLLLGLPVMMLLASFGLRYLVAASLALYAIAQVYGLTVPNFPTPGGWFFNPIAWQLIFVVGFAVGYRILKGETPVPYHPLAWIAAGGYLIWAMVHHRWNLYGMIPEIPFLPHNFQINEKPWVAFPRLMHILSLAYFVGHSPIMTWLKRLPASDPFSLMGRHALPVFWFGTALSMVGQVLMAGLQPSPGWQLVGLVAGLSIQIGVAAFLEWVAKAEARRRKAAAGQKSAPPAVREAANPAG